MNSIILCEGIDDVLIIGYFIYKTSNLPKWEFNEKAVVSENFKFLNRHGDKYEKYTRGKDKLVIWCVGGKDCFGDAIKTIHKFNTNFPNERFEEIVIFADRDKNDIDSSIKKVEDFFKIYGWEVTLENNKQNNFGYERENEKYNVNISPIIIPFDTEGALETVLMEAIAGTNDEDKFIVDSAKQYIRDIIRSGKITRYLQHDRLKLKAEFSAVISVTNPDRSTGAYNDLLMTHNWEEKDDVKKHLKLIEKIFK
jgi:hypothetical protein